MITPPSFVCGEENNNSNPRIKMSAEQFGKIVVADFEYEIRDGPSGDIYPLPRPLCLVAYLLDENLNRVRTIKLWREQLLASKRPPFDIGHDTLFVAYS